MIVLLAMVLAAGPARGTQPAAPAPMPTDKAGLLQQLAAQLEGLDYKDAARVSEALLARDDLTEDERIDVQLARGRILSVIADTTEAEPMFRLVLRARPDFDLPSDTPPRVLAVFRKVQVEERQAAAQLARAARQRLMAGVDFEFRRPERVAGGQPLVIELRVRDALGAVDQVRVLWRTAPGGFATIPLTRVGGQWKGVISASDLASESGLTLEYAFEAADAVGVLKRSPAELERAHRVLVDQGLVTTRKPVSVGAFAISASVSGAALVASGALWLVANLLSLQFTAPRTIETRDFLNQQQAGRNVTVAAVTVSITALVGLMTTLVLVPLTSFEPDRPVPSPFLP